MKAFNFNLQNVMEWHSRQAEAEHGELERMHGVRQEITLKREAVQAEQHDLREKLAGTGLWAAHELSQAANYQRTLNDRGCQIASEETHCAARIEAQRRRCVETDRKFRLLEKLRERRFAQWRQSYDAETENAAAASHLARFVRDSLT